MANSAPKIEKKKGETEIPDVGGNTGSGVGMRSHLSSATH